MKKSQFPSNPWLLAVFALSAAHHAHGQSSWIATGNGFASSQWGTASNWSGGVPNAIGATANMNSDLYGARSPQLAGDRTLGALAIDDPTSPYFGFTITPGINTPGARLTFDVASGSANLNSLNPDNNADSAISVPVTLNDPLSINWVKNNGGSIILTGSITDGSSSYSITKNGSGGAIFRAANSYDGGTTITAGRIRAENGGSFGTGTVTVANGGQAFLATGGTSPNAFSVVGVGDTLGALAYSSNSITSNTITLTGNARIGASGASTLGTMAGPLIGTANLEINSPNASHNGTITLSGNASGMTGAITVKKGQLALGPDSNPGGNVFVEDGARLSGETQISGNLELGFPTSTTTGATLSFDPSTSAKLTVNGNLSLFGTTTVVIEAVPFVAGTLPVLSYTGTFTGDLNQLALSNGLFREPPIFVHDQVQKLISLQIVNKSLVWTGAVNGNWNFTDENWADGATPSIFFDFDGVAFNIAPDNNSLPAVFTTNFDGDNDDLTFTAQTPGAAGEAIRIAYVDMVTANTPLGVVVSDNTISVTLAINGTNNLITTAAQIKAAIEASPAAAALVSVAFAAGNNGTGVPLPLPLTNLRRSGLGVTIPSGLVVRPPIATFDIPNGSTFQLAGPGTLSNAAIIKRGTGPLTIGHSSTYTTFSNIITGTSSILIEKGNLVFSSMVPFATNTPITLGSPDSDSDHTVLEIPRGDVDNVIVMEPVVTLGTVDPGDSSQAVIRYTGVSAGSTTTGGSPLMKGTINLNGRNLYLDNTSNLTGGTARRVNIHAAISGTGDVRVRAGANPDGSYNGAARVRLYPTNPAGSSVNNTWNGNLFVDTGYLQFGIKSTAGNNAVPDSALVTLAAGTGLVMSNGGETIRGLVGGAPTESVPFPAIVECLNGSVTVSSRPVLSLLDDNASNTHVFHGNLRPAQQEFASDYTILTLTKNGAATQVLTGDNFLPLTTTINGGTLEIGGAGTFTTSTPGNTDGLFFIAAGATFKFNSTANQFIRGLTSAGENSQSISGAGALIKDNTGTLTLSAGLNSHTGVTTLKGGILSVSTIGNGGVASNLGAASSAPGNIVFDGGTLQYTGATATSNRAFTINVGKTAVIDTPAATNNISLPGATGAATTGSLTKIGLGKLTLTGANTYGGNTIVSQGTLSLGNTNPGNDTSTVTIATDAILDLTYSGTDKVNRLFIGTTEMADGVYGKSGSALPVIGIPQITGDGTLSVVPVFAKWITGSFVNGSVPLDQRGPDDDPDNDGVRNLVEFAIAGQDPTVGNTTISTFTANSLSFTKRASTTGLTYAIQDSTDLGLADAWAEVSGGSYVNNATTITFTLTPGNPARSFLRLQVITN